MTDANVAAAVSALCVVVGLFCVAMDVVMLAAAVSVAVDRERNAVRAAELAAEERERYAMRAADLESLVAQRMFTSNLQMPQDVQAITYESAYTMRHNDLIDAHHALRSARDLLQRNDVEGALVVALDEVGSSSEAEGAEEESLDDDEPVEDMQTQLLDAVALPAPAAPAPAAEVRPFSGRCFRLDM